MKKINVLDTFAGAGGFSLGFSNKGFNIVGAIEVDKWASDTFALNHPESIVTTRDILSLSNEEVLEIYKEPIDIILGGPPCQGFSISNKKAGDPKDPRNSLFKEFVRMGELYKPKIMILENVPNLIKAKTESGELVVDVISNELKQLGYEVYVNLLNASDFGVPQTRRRLFIIASKLKLRNPFPKPTHTITNKNDDLIMIENLLPTPTLWDAISDLPEIEAWEGSEEMDYDKEAQNNYQSRLRTNSTKVFNHKAMNHSKRMVERFASMKWGDSTSDVPNHLKPLTRNGNGAISEKVYDQNNRRMFPDNPCNTITASFYANFVHPYKNRNFTAREGARIQSFPDTFRFMGKPTLVSQKLLEREGRGDERYLSQYNQIGNAVPPLLAQAIAENLLKEFNF